MDIQTETRTTQILNIMRVLSWIAFIALCIEGGAILVSYVVSLINPEAATRLYLGMDLYNLKQFSLTHYTTFVFIIAGISYLKAYMVYLVIQALTKVKLMNPFTTEMAGKLEQISYVLSGIYIITFPLRAYSDWIFKISGDLYKYEISGGFLFAAGLVFIIAQIFKRGVEIQSENELTV